MDQNLAFIGGFEFADPFGKPPGCHFFRARSKTGEEKQHKTGLLSNGQQKRLAMERREANCLKLRAT